MPPASSALSDAHGVVFDTRIGEEIVADAGSGALLRVDAETDEASERLAGIEIGARTGSS